MTKPWIGLITFKDKSISNRSKVIQGGSSGKLERLERGRLARSAAKLDPEFEKVCAEQGMSEELTQWPEY
jgi:hypothetical protein